ncbi:alpha/beta hydrolase fold domain-containing protein [Formosa sp. S-31]|uniref:alpha/beta hydrolase fold domain-containing protein n=1 Tax=Formosa sp. S-31 TaxID=2790949 RepID=UPI003EBCCCF4
MLKSHYIFLLLLLASNTVVFAQNRPIKDTSYTITSAYNKALKKYPDISIAKTRDTSIVKYTPNIAYKTTPNYSLYLDAFINTKNTNAPAVILIHGGGWKSGSKSLLHPLASVLAANGYNSFTIEYRLAPQNKFPDAVSDVFDAISFIKTQAATYNINPEQLIILGSSSGAQIASLVATTAHKPIFTKTPVNIKGLVNIDGILAFSHPKSEEGTLAASWLGDTETNNPELWKQASALTYVDQNCPPTLFIPSNFERFQAGRDEMIAILEQHHIYYKISAVHNAPHTFWLFNPWFDSVADSTINFLNYILK